MTLQEFMEKQDDERLFLIGCLTNYFFGGNKADYEAEIADVYRECKRVTRHYLLKARWRLRRTENQNDKLYKAALTSIERFEYNLNLPTFRDRQIIDIYKSVANPDVTIVIIEGTEKGRFWDLEEAQKG